MGTTKRTNICLLLNLNNKADRDRLSGALCFSAEQKDWNIWILDGSSENFLQNCTSRKIDGIIFSEQNLYTLAKRVIRFSDTVRLAAIDADHASPAVAGIRINLDVNEVTHRAAAILSGRGFVNLAFFGTDLASERLHARNWERAFADSANACGVYCGAFRMLSTPDWTASLEAAAQWVLSIPKPCGIMAYSDNLSRDLLDACRLAQVQVPQQVAIIGVDNAVEICETAVPSLSSILPDFELSGYLAAQHIDHALRTRRRTTSTNISYGIKSVVERASTQDLRGCGRTVTAALKIIRQEAGKNLTVADLASRLHLSKRLLSLHFNTVLGHGAHQEIENVRMELLERMLCKDLSRPLNEIAIASGYRTVGAAQAAFRKRHKSSMSAYRVNSNKSASLQACRQKKH